jgi:hypothetical protein
MNTGEGPIYLIYLGGVGMGYAVSLLISLLNAGPTLAAFFLPISC